MYNILFVSMASTIPHAVLVTALGDCEVTKAVTLYSKYPFRYIQSKRDIKNSKVLFISLLNYGGGYVSGDCGSFVWKIGEETNVCICTQGSSRIFASKDGNKSEQLVRHTLISELSRGSLTIYTPDPIMVLKNACYDQSQIFLLEKNASLVFVDWFSSGRKPLGEGWSLTHLESTLELWEEDVLVLKDSFDLKGNVTSKVGGAGVFGIIVLIGCKTASVCSLVESLYQGRGSFEYILNPSSIIESCEVSVSRLTCRSGHALIVRFTATDTEHGYSLLHKLLSPLELELGFKPYSDRLVANITSSI